MDHDLKLLGSWIAPHGIHLSSSFEFISGYHREKRGWCSACGSCLTMPEGRGGRTTPAHAYVDISDEKRFALTERYSLGLGINICNLFNSQRPVSCVKEDSELFGQVWGRQLPLWAQLSLSLRF